MNSIGAEAVPEDFSNAIDNLFAYMNADSERQDDAATIRHYEALSQLSDYVSSSGKALLAGMDNRDQTAWQVQFPEPGLAGFANDMAQALREGGVDGVGAPVLVPPKVSQYNAATVVLMIAATSIGKAAVVYGLRALEKMIAERLDRGDENTLKIEVKGETGRPMPFACSLKSIGRDSLKRFFDGVVNQVEKL